MYVRVSVPCAYFATPMCLTWYKLHLFIIFDCCWTICLDTKWKWWCNNH